MQDRVSLYPGRIKLTPVPGQDGYYDLERADQPTQEGTALNKNNLLKDATAALFGLGVKTVIDDVLALIGNNLYNGLGNQYLWAVSSESMEVVISDKEYIAFVYDGDEVQYSTSYTVGDDGTLSLVNPSTTTMTHAQNTVLHGKYVKFTAGPTSSGSLSGEVFGYCVRTYDDASGMFPDLTVKLVSVKPSGNIIKYVSSDLPNAYPPLENDGYTYTALGQLGAKKPALTSLLDVTTTGSYLATYTLADSIENYKVLIVQLANFKTTTTSGSEDRLYFGPATSGPYMRVYSVRSDGAPGPVTGVVVVDDVLSGFEIYNGDSPYAFGADKSTIGDLTKVTISGNQYYPIAAGATIKIWGLN